VLRCAGDGSGLSAWSQEEIIGAASGRNGEITSPLVKSLQSRLERAEEQCALPLCIALLQPWPAPCDARMLLLLPVLVHSCALQLPAAR
jgi:hypothetical protein